MMGNADLRYTDWEYTRRRDVEAAGNGAIRYVHLRAMGANDMNQWEVWLTGSIRSSTVVLLQPRNWVYMPTVDGSSRVMVSIRILWSTIFLTKPSTGRMLNWMLR
jgi:hypothetical protein